MTTSTLRPPEIANSDSGSVDPGRPVSTAANSLTDWRWWHWLGAIAFAALTIIPTWDAWADTIGVARNDEESGHILLVPFVFAWLFFIRRSRLSACRVTIAGRWVGVGIAVFGWLTWRYGYFHGRDIPWHAGPIIMLIGAFIACTGKDLLVKFLPAFGVLAFLVHITASWRQKIAGPMQEIAATATQMISSALGMDVVRQGSVLDVAGVDVAVAEACNGMRMVVTLILASYVFAFVNPLGRASE